MSYAPAVARHPLEDINLLTQEFDALRKDMDRLKDHQVFRLVRDMEDLRTFMRWHVFAVWDFMSLVKRLQQDLTCVAVPWMPPANAKAARLINDIVLGEESDEAMDGAHASHFELYLTAMQEVGAPTREIMNFLRHMCSGVSAPDALTRAGAHPAVAEFVCATLETACNGKTHEVLGSFFFGRENVIPRMFSSLLDSWTVDANAAPTFVYYLKRHIELDGDSHGPAAETLIEELLKDDTRKRSSLLKAARQAVRQRIKLWDALAAELA
jgi:hypothetical protein